MQTRTSQGQNFQDTILANLCGRRAPATLYLNNRMAMHGRILDFDAYVLLLEPADGGPVQMIYKSAVVSVTGPPQRRRPSGRPYDGPREGRGREGGYRDRGGREGEPREGRPSYGGDRGPRPEWRGENRPRPQGGYGGDRPRPQGGYGADRPRPQSGGYGGDRGPRPYGGGPHGSRPGGYGGERRGPWQERSSEDAGGDRPPRRSDDSPPPSRDDAPPSRDE
jgi:RNA chaperone Hfq